MKFARAVNTWVLKTWNFDNLESSLVHTNIDQCFNFKSITINIYVVKTVPPAGVVAVAQISEIRPEQQVDQLTQPIVAGAAQERDIVTPATLGKTRTFGKIIAC